MVTMAGITRRQFNVAEYHRMAEVGILCEDDRVELLDGEIWQMSPIGSRHAACVDRLNRLLSRRAEDDTIVRVQSPIQLDDYSEPQPDLALLRMQPDFYAEALPTAGDVLLMIEVADTSLEYDRRLKLPRYAQAGIPEVWLVDLNEHSVRVYTQPFEDGYRVIQQLHPGQSVSATRIAGLAVAVNDMLGEQQDSGE
ncbi:MAG: Uma2 family endonuclease [Chloroflexi bacterium]|nr:Uma2 family endonuclease [Chloroflexota bacterium]